MDSLRKQLEQRRQAHLYRQRQVVEGPQGVELRIGNEHLLSFCSNDYLGLANHPAVIAAFHQGAERYGAGAGASHLITGHSRAHHELEEALAEFVRAPRALLFSTGYMTNLGVVSALTDRHATVFEDKLNHASLIDAARLCGAKVKRYRHGDSAALATALTPVSGGKLIMTDGVFSMDGDSAPLAALYTLAQEHAAWLLVDDAHGLGVLGEHGGGLLEQTGIRPADPLILMGTLGKAFGTFGAFVAGSEDLIETLIQSARTYIYTTALPPAVAVATLASLRLVQTESWRRAALRERVTQFRRGAMELGLNLMESATAIQPVLLGSPERAVAASAALRERGILVSAIRPPTVPQNTARLRITFSADHTAEHVDRLLDALSALGDAR